jgi:hypothetical protein
MSAKNGEDEWLLQFDRPTDEQHESLRLIFSSLKSSPFVETQLRQRKEVALEGTLSEVLARVRVALDADCRDNQSDHEASWSFDYVVTRDALYPDAVLLLTRLYAQAESGSVMYGRFIKRIGDDLYLLWIDD